MGLPDPITPINGASVPAPPPGVYPGVDFDTYCSWDAVNQTLLNRFSRSPLHVHYEITTGGITTPALELGWLTHLATFEPDRYRAEVAVAPNIDKRSKKGKALWAPFLEENDGKIIATWKDDRRALEMAAAVRAHPTARLFLNSRGRNELSIVWHETIGDYRIVCKARLDRYSFLNEWPMLGDLKTSRNAARRPFERSILDYGYDVQASHYLTGLETLYPIEPGDPYRKFIFIVVESSPPHAVALYELDDDSLEEGDRKRKHYLNLWRRCVETGSWPGYPDGIQTVSLPAWALKMYIDD